MSPTLAPVQHVLLRCIAGVAMLSTPLAAQSPPAPWSITVGPEVLVDIAHIYNAPNGHIPYSRSGSTWTLWVDGRTFAVGGRRGTQGTFVIQPKSWSVADLTAATSSQLVYEATHDTADHRCTTDSAWRRNYAAINSIVRGPSGQLLAFIDGEFHPKSTGTPLHSAIGVATSSDGTRWSAAPAVIQGTNMVATKFDCNAVDSLMTSKIDNVGPSGPSAVVRSDGSSKYIYVYYLDRVLQSKTTQKSGNIYVARSAFASAGAPNTWQFWTKTGWSPAGREVLATPVVTAPQASGEAAQPHVTFNKTLNRWLMIYHTRGDLYAASSADGIAWDTPRPLNAATAQSRAPGFPTFVDTTAADDQTTGASGLLFYSRSETVPSDTSRKYYPGYVRTVLVSAGPPRPTPPTAKGKSKCGTPVQCCRAAGGTMSGGRCS